VTRPVSRLFVPADPVVAIHDSDAQAKAAIDFLGRAGYTSRMLNVVDRRSPQSIRAAEPAGRPARQWHTSGTVWGLIWSACALVGAAVVARQALPLGMILMVGALLLAIQTAIVRSCLAPEPATQAFRRGPQPSELPYAKELAENRTLLLVSGSRSEIALARSLLRLRDAAIDGA
jgi:hypothetical protein